MILGYFKIGKFQMFFFFFSRKLHKGVREASQDSDLSFYAYI